MLNRWNIKHSKYHWRAKGRHSVNTCQFYKIYNRLIRRHHQTVNITSNQGLEKKKKKKLALYTLYSTLAGYGRLEKNKIPKNRQIKSTILSQACLQYEASNRHSSILKRYVGEEATDLVIVRKTTLHTSLFCPEFRTSNLAEGKKKNKKNCTRVHHHQQTKSYVSSQFRGYTTSWFRM